MKTPNNIKAYCENMLNDYESFKIIALNAKNKPLNEYEIKGTTNHVNVKAHMRDIFMWLLNNRFDKVVMVHNHPSGNIKPSKADDELTEALNELLNTFDIALLDHVIITYNSYYSYKEDKLIKNNLLNN